MKLDLLPELGKNKPDDNDHRLSNRRNKRWLVFKRKRHRLNLTTVAQTPTPTIIIPIVNTNIHNLYEQKHKIVCHWLTPTHAQTHMHKRKTTRCQPNSHFTKRFRMINTQRILHRLLFRNISFVFCSFFECR